MKFILYFTGSSEKVVIAISLARIYVSNVAPISVDACLVHSVKLRTYIATLMHNIRICSVYAASMVLTGNSMSIAVKFGINTTSVVLEMINFTRRNGDKFHEAKPSEIYHFQYNKSGIYPKFHCYPCYY